MDLFGKKIIVNGAVSQYDRLQGLPPQEVDVDGRSFVELLNFGTRFAGLVRFYDLKDQVDGDWTDFFRSDSTMILASLQAPDLESLETDFLHAERETADARTFPPKVKLLRSTFEVVLVLGRAINLWLESLRLDPSGEITARIEQRLAAEIEDDLGAQMRLLKSYADGAALPQGLDYSLDLDFSGFLPIWRLQDAVPDASIYRGRSRVRKIDCALPHLAPIFYALLHAAVDLQAAARAAFPATLQQNDHHPQAALYIAFAELFSNAQNTINRLSRRYTRFYYRDVLREPRRGPVGDRLNLTFTLADDEGTTSSLVPQGNLFPAGQNDDGEEILYAADQSLETTAARLEKVRMLRVVHGELITGSHRSSRVARRVLSTEVLLEAPDYGELAWNTFGEPRRAVTPVSVTEPAAFGFAAASPYLLLTGGTRRVFFSVFFTLESIKLLEPLLDELSAATGIRRDEIFRRVLRRAFTLYLSTAAGWLPVEGYLVHQPVGGVDGFQLAFELPASTPPIVPFDPEDPENADPAAPVSEDPVVLASNPDPSLPTLKAYLRQEPVRIEGPLSELDVFPLSLLGELEILRFRIVAEVEGLDDLELENTDGVVDPSSPFPVFGGIPTVGSYLDIRRAELFRKTLKTLRLRLRWFNLPPGSTGFKGYYRDYTIGPDGQTTPDLFNNQTFRGEIEVRNPGPWRLRKETPHDLPYLFRTSIDSSPPGEEGCDHPVPIEDGRLCPETGFDGLGVESCTLPPYYDPSLGAIRLTLAAPPYAFGDSIYPQNVLEAVIDALPNTSECQARCLDECEPYAGPSGDPIEYRECLETCMRCCLSIDQELPYPNEPYLPQATSVTIDYATDCSQDSAEGECGSLFLLLPFGGVGRPAASRQSRREPPVVTALLPRFVDPGNLFLGFSGLIKPQTLTLLFRSASDRGAVELPPVSWSSLGWSRLSDDGWRKLPPPRVLSDTTGGLQGTGIVALALSGGDLPNDPGPVPETEESTTQWLRVSTPRTPGRFPATLSIVPQALTASLVAPEVAGELLARPLPAGTVTSSVEDLADIATIDQPMDSYGGRPPETRRNFDLRVGERLRHKDRAIVAWDYEHLVLERFPTVWKVQALTARTVLRGQVPGAVLVVIVPGPESREVTDPTEPFASGEMLREIKDYLTVRSSPFVCLEVVNPVYVRIEVIASVLFTSPETTGASIDRLNSDLIAYLSPWFFDAARAARGGSYVSPADISEFIQTRPYVEALESFRLAYRSSPENATSEWCFLTSAEAHQIQAAVAGDPSGCDSYDPCKDL